MSLYHNDILGRRLVVDGVIAAIPTSARASLLDRFCQRLGLAGRGELESYWHRLMDFWSDPEPAADETALNLRLTLFHRMVNRGAADGRAGGPESLPAPPATAVPLAAAAFRGRGLPAHVRSRPPVTASGPGFLDAAVVRRIVNAASFLMQEHGVLFDAAFEVRPALLAVPGPAPAAATIVAFREELDAQVQAWGGEVRASLTVVERDALGVVGRIVAHLRAPNPLDPADADGADRTEVWVRAWQGGAICGGADAVRFAAAPSRDGPAALAFHWRHVLALCAGLDRRAEAWDPAVGTYRPLLALLGVQPRDTRAFLDRPLVAISALLSDKAVAEACGDRLTPLSAIDDEAWRYIRTGWELDEFHVRQALRAERPQELAGLRQRHGDDTPEARAAIEVAVKTWPSNPRMWGRRWRGWWV